MNIPYCTSKCHEKIIKSSLYSRYYAEACNEWRVHLRGLVPGQHSSEETSQRWRVVSDTMSDLTGIEFTSSRDHSGVLNKYANVIRKLSKCFACTYAILQATFM